jgi:diaminobutyrate-2-oxoglutarate transaminase
MTTQHDLTAAPDVFAFVRAKESAARSYADSVDRVLDSGVLSRVWDTEGRSYLDFLSNAGTLAAGHNHP